MNIEITTSDPDAVDPARIAALLEADNFFVMTVSVNEGERIWEAEVKHFLADYTVSDEWGVEAHCNCGFDGPVCKTQEEAFAGFYSEHPEAKQPEDNEPSAEEVQA